MKNTNRSGRELRVPTASSKIQLKLSSGCGKEKRLCLSMTGRLSDILPIGRRATLRRVFLTSSCMLKCLFVALTYYLSSKSYFHSFSYESGGVGGGN